ncbi:hypothetical protein ACF08M_08425 [Streptomyces sp. NPDC015032]|uniref:hypothetical protein n=1 Tax=Streptomyces sp. NPDC015032 TaxID=3364937 RepID=UPI0036FFAE6A
MEEQLTTLAATAATTVVNLLATDTWEQVRVLVGRLWQRHRPEQAAAVEDELGIARELLLSPAHEEDGRDLTATWRVRFRQLLATDQAAARALTELVAELTAGPREEEGGREQAPPRTEMRAQADGDAEIYQAGHNMTNIRLS